MRNSFQNKSNFVRENRVGPTSQLLNLTEHIEDGYEKQLINGTVSRYDWRRTPDRPDTHHAGKQTFPRGAEREEAPTN